MIDRALVTGGAGFIGANLVDRLVDDGAAVLVVDDLSSGRLERLAEARQEGHVRVHQLDVRDESLVEVVAKFAPTVIFHLATRRDESGSGEGPVAEAEFNVVGTVNVLHAAAMAEVTRFVFASSGAAIYGAADKVPTPESAPRRPASPGGLSKVVVDEYLRYYLARHGINYVSLGFSSVYGPRQDALGEAGEVADFILSFLAGESPMIHGDGNATRDYVYVEDVTDACVRAASHDGGEYLNIGTGVETPVLDLFRMLRELTGASVPPTFADPRPGELQRSALDPSRAAKVIGWKPWTGLRDGLRSTVDWFVAH